MRNLQLRKHVLSFFALIVFVLLAVGSVDSTGSSSGSSPVERRVPKTAEEIRKEQIEKQFSVWDGSHRGLTKVIKDSMNDPKSYEHIETIYWDEGDYLTVTTTFRGKNVFGGVVKNSVTAKVDLNGNVLEIMSQ